MTAPPAEISTFWHGDQLPAHIRLCLKSFVDHGHALTLYSYDEIQVPRGIRVRDANAILPHSRLFYYRTGVGAGSVAGFANLFRYKLLLEHGGWWVDTDVLCLSPVLPEGSLVFGWEAAGLLGSAVLKIPRGHDLASRLLAEAEKIVEDRGEGLAWGETGPNLFTRVVIENGLDGIAAPTERFYPLHWTEFELVLQPGACAGVTERTRNSSFLHLWNEMFRRHKTDIATATQDGSYLARRFDQHGLRNLLAFQRPAEL